MYMYIYIYIYIYAVTDNGASQCFHDGVWEAVDDTSPYVFDSDLFLAHWDEESFAHCDAVYCEETRQLRCAPRTVRARLHASIRGSAFLNAGRSWTLIGTARGVSQ